MWCDRRVGEEVGPVHALVVSRCPDPLLGALVDAAFPPASWDSGHHGQGGGLTRDPSAHTPEESNLARAVLETAALPLS